VTSELQSSPNSDKVDPEEMKEAAKKKDEGNSYFSKGDYARAEELFTEAIAMTEALDFTKPEMVDARKKRAVFFNNRLHASPVPEAVRCGALRQRSSSAHPLNSCYVFLSGPFLAEEPGKPVSALENVGVKAIAKQPHTDGEIAGPRRGRTRETRRAQSRTQRLPSSMTSGT
jgi:hypothetical protein